MTPRCLFHLTSKNYLCDIVFKAWNSISTDIIKKSFDCCGQSKESVPEQVTCMKKGKLAEEAFEKVKEIWNAKPKSSKNDEAQNRL